MPRTGHNRASRVADQIRIEVADILLHKTRDPRLSAVTVTDVDLTADLRQAHVYFTSLMDEPQGNADVQSGLDRAAGFIRSELGRRLHLRYTPELMFHYDVSGPRGDRILSILEGIGQERDPQQGPPDGRAEKAGTSGDDAPDDASKVR